MRCWRGPPNSQVLSTLRQGRVCQTHYNAMLCCLPPQRCWLLHWFLLMEQLQIKAIWKCFTVGFDLVSKRISRLLSFCFNTLFDWLTKRTIFSANDEQDQLAQVTCMFFELWFLKPVVNVHCDWSEFHLVWVFQHFNKSHPNKIKQLSHSQKNNNKTNVSTT